MIFILGGKGLVGSAFARHCERMGVPFAVVDRDEYSSYVGKACDVLINANGNSNKRLAISSPTEEFDASVRSVRAALADFRFNKYVQISSCDVYPDCSRPELTRESQILDPAAQSPYGFHKSVAEQCVRHAGRNWLIFRCGGFLGPGLRKNAIYDILHGGPLYLAPSSELQFLHTDRAAEIVFRMLEMGASHETFNLCGKGTVALSEVAALTGGPVPVAPGSPCVRYEISLEKISRLVEPPETRAAVFEFVNAELRERSART
jgi:nucleoside-diphosphate-sugar epimerase